MFVNPQGQSNDTKSLQGAYDNIFMQYQVDFTTYGHIHVYSRCVHGAHIAVVLQKTVVTTLSQEPSWR